MNDLSQCAAGRSVWANALGAAGFSLGVLALGACAQNGMDDVKPTATTAYHSGEAVSPPSAPAPAPARE
ncbi:hypothetical protein C0Z18_11900 [Trinickia dabaoshanensis]|uniref:Lipoprotein n=1 Tax=Trinickia dabaoshanensis TaxID=564714 RepID=A0A2N7VSI3_9BURK|nr:hypothetical protein [Trinickia dabaoshanensis]PMS20103.1 hypothetical protein C0Z18_11900 [Trinickia dabaoshanensis]